MLRDLLVGDAAAAVAVASRSVYVPCLLLRRSCGLEVPALLLALFILLPQNLPLPPSLPLAIAAALTLQLLLPLLRMLSLATAAAVASASTFYLFFFFSFW